MAFTLVELIVTIVIIAVLATISFISISNYPRNARDSVRKSDIKNIEELIKIYQVQTWKLPTPDNIIIPSSQTWWIEWDFWVSVKELVKNISELPTDPQTWANYKYFIKEDRSVFKIEAELEDWEVFTLWTYNVPKVAGNTSGLWICSFWNSTFWWCSF